MYSLRKKVKRIIDYKLTSMEVFLELLQLVWSLRVAKPRTLWASLAGFKEEWELLKMMRE